MRAATFDVTVDLFVKLLEMPPTAWITGASMTDDGRCIRLTVHDANLPEADEPHEVDPTVTERRVEWNWNLPA